jgi:hypothetical protein
MKKKKRNNIFYRGTNFVFNEDYTGEVTIVTKGYSIETTIEALEDFIKYKNSQLNINNK